MAVLVVEGVVIGRSQDSRTSSHTGEGREHDVTTPLLQLSQPFGEKLRKASGEQRLTTTITPPRTSHYIIGLVLLRLPPPFSRFGSWLPSAHLAPFGLLSLFRVVVVTGVVGSSTGVVLATGGRNRAIARSTHLQPHRRGHRARCYHTTASAFSTFWGKSCERPVGNKG